MRDVMVTVTKLLFYIVAGVLLFWTSSLTITFVGKVLPALEIAKFFALIVFDIGAVCWLLIFLFSAEGVFQRSIALLITLADFAGVGVMTIAEIITGAQVYVTGNQAAIGGVAVWVLAVWTILNLAAVFAYHFADPASIDAIHQRSELDKVMVLARQRMSEKMGDIAERVADEQADLMTKAALERLQKGRKPTQLPALPAQPQVSIIAPNGHKEKTAYNADTELVTANPPRRQRPPQG